MKNNLYVTIKGHEPILVERCVDISNAFDCDPEIYPMLRMLWDKGYSTAFSCSGHVVIEKITPYGKEVLNQCNYDCYISLRTNTVVNDISDLKVGWAEIQVVDEWMAIKRIINNAEIPIPDNFVYDISNQQTRIIVANAILATGGNPTIVNSMIDRLHGDAKTYIIRATIPNRTRKRMLDGTTTYLDQYKALCKCRSDLIKLIEKLPDNIMSEVNERTDI